MLFVKCFEQCWYRVVNGPQFEARTRNLVLKSDLCPKAKYTKWVKICATAGFEKTLCAGIAADGFVTPKIANTLTKNWLKKSQI